MVIATCAIEFIGNRCSGIMAERNVKNENVEMWKCADVIISNESKSKMTSMMR
jgi:hypothetical protein